MATIGSEPLLFFGAIAAIIFLGFLGNLVFSRLRFNDTVLLIGVGVLLGPVFQVVDPESLARASAIVGPLALILILFDGGLALKFQDLARGAGSAATLAVLGFALTTGLLGVLVAWALQGDGTTLLGGLILGAILGGTSALVVLPSLKYMKTEPKTATVLGLESAVTDVLVVVVAFTLIQFAELGQAPGAQGIAQKLVVTFAMSILIGAAAAFLWLWLLPSVRDKPFGYMMTLGAMFFLYVAVEWLLQGFSSGGGPLAVLAFGVLLGNASSMGAKMRARIGDQFGQGIKKFQGEIAFIVRTFFFVYLGILVDLSLLQNLWTWALAVLMLAVMLVARYISVAVTTRSPRLRGDAAVMFVMMPRGLAAAVLAAVPAQQEIPGTERFVALAFLALILTNLLATFGSMWLEKMPRDDASIELRKKQRLERAAARRNRRVQDADDEELEFTSAKEKPSSKGPRRKDRS